MSSNLVAPSTPPDSATERPSDPWRPAGVVRHGIHKGAALDIDHFRSATLLTPEQATLYRPAEGEILVANFRHDDHWFIARVRADLIQDLIFHLEWTGDPFPGVHNQLRVLMQAGGEVTLEPQIAGEPPSDACLPNILLSSEGNFAPGTAPRWRGGLEQASIAHMAMSMEQKAAIMSGGGVHPHRVIQARLRLTERQKQDVLLTYLRHATAVGTDEMFNLITWNCSSPLFQALDRCAGYGLLRSVLAMISLSSMPHWARANLRLRGILDSQRPLPEFFAEFPLRANE
jgi:hypothetical protein